jgi:DNA-binding response OmpR family regulator
MAAKVLLIESARANAPSFAPALKKHGYDLYLAHSGKGAIRLATRDRPDVIVLDAASLRTSGNRICSQLRNYFEQMPIIHIKSSPENGQCEAANLVLYLPFTARKLINRIERFLNAHKGRTIECGPFKLNLQQRLLSAHGKEHRLTPKLAQLMEAFMRNPGQTLNRKYLMRNVWQTDYLGDTRTLDVHIRWIREAVEREPGKPRYVITVRGVGYRFDPELSEHR